MLRPVVSRLVHFPNLPPAARLSRSRWHGRVCRTLGGRTYLATEWRLPSLLRLSQTAHDSAAYDRRAREGVRGRANEKAH